MTSTEEVAVIASRIEGWLSNAQGRALFSAAERTTGRGAIVEIGSWKGRSTTWLGYGAKARGLKVYAVDPHQGSREDPDARTFEAFIVNISRAGVVDAVQPLVMTSAEAVAVVEGPVELLFIDGDHSPAGAQRDAELWLPRLMVGGTAMFHDVATSGYDGPRRVFQQKVCRSEAFHRLRRVGSMAIAERTAKRSRLQALRSFLFDLLLYRYDLERALKRGMRNLRRRSIRRSPTPTN